MEKTKNGWYKAVSIILFVFASLFVVGIIAILAVGLSDPEALAKAINEANASTGGDYEVYTAESVKTLIWGIAFMFVPSAVIMFCEAVVFDKNIYMTDQEAAERFKSSVVWTVVSFFFGGTIVGVLALVGLLSIHERQKERYQTMAVVPETVANDQEQTPAKAADSQPKQEAKPEAGSDKVKKRLEKLESLKASGAISDEEYKQLKDKILK